MGKYERTIEYVENGSQLVGTTHRELIDKKTGEMIEVEQTLRFKYGTKHFWKCYRTNFLRVMDSLEGAQFKVFIYILRNTRPSDNLFICTYDKMAKKVKTSKRTVASTLRILQEKNFIAKKQKGIWVVNPYTFMKGNDAKCQQIYSEYKQAKDKPNTENEEKDSKDAACGQEQHGEAVKGNCGETPT
ncbi:MAG: replication/maintenance protein RepL [Roseburia sp. 1XD42-69]